MTDTHSDSGTLYNGPDLRIAAARSTVRHSIVDTMTNTRNAVGLLFDAVGRRLSSQPAKRFEVVQSRGPVIGGSDALTVVYAGTGENRHWCMSVALGKAEVVDRQSGLRANAANEALGRLVQDANLVFVEGLPASLPASDFLRMPAWIKQRVQVCRSWEEQIDTLRRSTRQQIARILRKYGYACRQSRQLEDFLRFYNEIYVPHARARFGDAAIIVERERFLRECARGILIELHKPGEIVAAALLRPHGRTLAVVWTGLYPTVQDGSMPGATDALDYFSLLYAHLKGFHWLDFGPSRPDLRDGPLRYKHKWGAVIRAGVFRQAEIRLTCSGRHDAELAFLRQHAFICHRKRGLGAVVCLANLADVSLLQQLSTLVSPGVDDYLLVLDEVPEDKHLQQLASVARRITIARAANAAEALDQAARFTVKAPRPR